jgi:hypothetical protein
MPTTVATDDFNRADGGLGANWTTGNGSNPAIASNVAGGAGVTYSMAFWNANAFNDDQYAQVQKAAAADYIACAVRANATSGGNCYANFINSSNFHKLVNGTWSQFTALTGASNGDTIRIEVEGTTLRHKVNGVTTQTTTDASLSAGAAGVAFYSNTSKVDNWEGGNMADATGGVKDMIMCNGFIPFAR